jgi:hypothetical protein
VEDVLLMYRTAKAVRIPGRTNGIQITQDKHGRIVRVTRTVGIRHRTVFNAVGMRVGETETTARVSAFALRNVVVNSDVFLRSAAWRAEGWVPALPEEEKVRLLAEVAALWKELDAHEADARRLHEENRQAKLSGKGAEERIRKGMAQLCKAVKGTVGVEGLTSGGMARIMRIHSVYGCFGHQPGNGSVQFDTKRMSEVELELSRNGTSLRDCLRQAHLWAEATGRTSGLGTFLQYVSQHPLIAGLLDDSHVEEARKLSLVEDVMEA